MKRFTLLGIIILAAVVTACYFIRPAPIDISLDGMRYPIFNCEIEKVRAGIKAGFDINTRGEDGDTPLYFAIMNGQTVSQRQDMVKLLLEAGANPNVTNSYGETLLNAMIYIATNDVDCVLVEELLRAGANTELKDGNDMTPLMVAAGNHYTDAFAKLLIKYGANVNACTTNGITPLTVAASNPMAASPDLVKAMISAGANVNAANVGPFTVLDKALSEVQIYKTNENKKVIVNLLLEAGAKKGNWGGEEPDIKPAK